MKAGPAKSCPSCGERYDTDVLFCPRDGTPLASTRNPSFAQNGGPNGAQSDRDPYLGVELPGQIRLDHLIGIGSMGRVYRAFQGGIERDVAVKVLHRELSGNAELVQRFHREAKIASRLVHPNVVQVLMTGALPQSADARSGGELYLVMEHLDGFSLLSALAAAGTLGEGAALPLPRALHIALQVCDAVGEAHVQGITHRDIKPENVMLVRRGDDPDYAKVLDFGIARLDWADRGMATQAGLIFGTAKYISPEGAEGLPVGPAADVYSIATMLYQMLAGRTPFEGDSPVALLVQHTHTPPTDLRSIARASYVPAPLAAAIMANLSKKPGERAQNARLLAKDLVAAARASGLYPEELATQSTLFSPATHGTVKLASKERTRAHELSAELAARIGGVSTITGADALRHGVGGATTTAPTLPSAVNGARRGEPQGDAGGDGGAMPDTNRPFTSLPSAMGLASGASPAMRSPQLAPAPHAAPVGATPLDLDGVAGDEGPVSTLPGSPLGAAPDGRAAGAGSLNTMHGTETTLDDEPVSSVPTISFLPRLRRARVARLAAIVACVLVTLPILIVGGRKLGGFGGTAVAGDSLDSALEEGRDCLRRRAWDEPPVHNFKEVTDGAVARFPESTTLADLRREAAERLVADALGRKYAGDLAAATHLVGLALHFDPQLTTAQRLAADLDLAGGRSLAPDVAPASSASASADRGKAHRGRDARVAEPRPDPRAPTPRGSTSPASGAVLPPPPAPHPRDAPAPQPTGPWL